MSTEHDTTTIGANRTDDAGPAMARPLRELVRTVEADDALDRHADTLERSTRPLATGGLGAMLRGDTIGHALHPAMTDLPLGCWTSASVLDLVGGRAARPAARRLVALGLLGSLPTAMTGLAEFHTIRDERARRVATVHAGGNAVVMLLQLLSWRARRADHHLRGTGWSLAGGAASLVTGYLGGHLLSALGEGIGARGVAPGTSTAQPGEGPGRVDVADRADGPVELLDLHDAAATLGVAEQQIPVLVDQGLLVVARDDGSGDLWFHPTDVEAARLTGG
jgi:uncharacterized membrane protein